MIIHELSRFLIDLSYESIPEESLEKTKLCFLDYLSVYFRGLESENSRIAVKTIYELYGESFNSLNKGFINGIASHSLDLDDGHRMAQLHPGSVVFSTILALLSDKSINLDISAEEFFEAVVGAYEIAIVLGMLVNPYHRNQGFHSTGTIGAFASGAVASRLLKLDLEKTEHCLGLCATQSSALLEADHAGTMGKSLHAGNAVYAGILSAFLAKNGFTGGESLIDGKEGFLKAMVSDLNDYNGCDEESFKNISRFLEDNLGKFHINEIYLKKYPFCRHIHSSIDSILNLKESCSDGKGLDVDSIDSIDVFTYGIASEHDNYDPNNIRDIKQSLPYAIALSLVLDDLTLDSIDEIVEKGLFESASDDEDVLMAKELASKVNIILDEGLDALTPQKRPSRVLVHFNGDSLSDSESATYYPLGEPENPLSVEDIMDKFRLLNPKFNMDRLQIINSMESHSIIDVFDELGLLD